MERLNSKIDKRQCSPKTWAGSRNLRTPPLKLIKGRGLKIAEGFTFIELLVVIAVITMIFSAIFVLYDDSKRKSRDARREQDIKELQKALDLFNINQQQYPQCGNDFVVINGATDCLSDALITEGAMIGGTPTDPINSSGGGCGAFSGAYVYCYFSDNGVSYVLKYHLETDSIPCKSPGWYTAGP